jgi:hypothetical protein
MYLKINSNNFLNSIRRPAFITEMECVNCAVRPRFLYTEDNFRFWNFSISRKNWLIYSTNFQRSQRETNSCSSSQQISKILKNSKFDFLFRRPYPWSLLQVTFSRQANFLCLHVHFNIILSSTLRNSEWFLPFSFTHSNFNIFLTSAMCVTCKLSSNVAQFEPKCKYFYTL